MALKEQLKSLATDLEGLRKSLSELTNTSDTHNERGTDSLPVTLSNIRKGYKQPLGKGEKNGRGGDVRCLGTGNAYVESDVASKDDMRSGYGCRGGGVGRAVRGRMDRKGLGTVGGTNSIRSSSMGIDYGKSSVKEVVRGVRRIWGTVKSSSHFSVKNAIVQLADIESMEKIHVKRKYKSTSTGKPKWWYVIHAEEEAILKPLEEYGLTSSCKLDGG